MNRRRFLSAVLLVVTTSVLAAQTKTQRLLYVGTYTDGESKGIYAYRFSDDGELTPLGLAAETRNPSFLTLSADGRFLYAVNETGDFQGKSSGAVSAFRVEDESTGKLTFLNQVPSGGADPCYVAIDHTGKYVLVANYTGGSISVFPIKEDGSLGQASQFIRFSGSSGNAQRQEGPHAHWIDVSPDNRFVIVADLGTDKLMVYRFDATKGTLLPNDPPFVKLTPGVGPRHPEFSPDGRFLYVVNEMQSGVTVLSYDKTKGVLKELQNISMLPKDFTAENTAAEIQIDRQGKFLYASNRGHDSIAAFAINPKNGTLTFIEAASTQGKEPRYFAIDPSGKFLLAANQNSNSIAVFRIDAKTGRLTATGKTYPVGAPVCLKFSR